MSRRKKLRQNITHEPTFEIVNCIHRQPYTMVEVRVVYDGVIHEGFGFSKVQYPDVWDPIEGRRIATIRAVKDLVDSILWKQDV